MAYSSFYAKMTDSVVLWLCSKKEGVKNSCMPASQMSKESKPMALEDSTSAEKEVSPSSLQVTV